MRIVVDTEQRQDLTAQAMLLLDSRLRQRWPNLREWSYSPLTGELTLEFNEEERLAALIRGVRSEGILQRIEAFGNEVRDAELYSAPPYGEANP